MLREQWLTCVGKKIETLFLENGYRMPNYLITCGNENLSQARLAHELVISRHISDPLRAADILAHEMVHAAVGLPQGHNTAFAECARAIGLEGDVHETVAGEAFQERVRPWLDQLGSFPNATLFLRQVG